MRSQRGIPVRHVKIMDNISRKITRDGIVDLGEGYERCEDVNGADAILVRASDIHGMDLGPNVRCVARSGAGYNNIPIEDCARRGIVVFNTPGGNSNAVKELVVGMILVNSRGTLGGINWVLDNAQDPDIVRDAERNKKAFVGHEAIGRKVGVVGLGAVGSKVANALVSLGLDVHGYDPYLSVEHAWQLSRSVKRVDSLDELCRDADYVSLHVPSKDDTVRMIGARQIALMHEGAMLVNYARADIIDEDAVAAALKDGRLGSLVCDFATPKTTRMPRTMITPHMGACTNEAEENCAAMAVSQMKDYLESGIIRNSVNYPDCDLGPVTSGLRIAALHDNVPNMIGQITAVLARYDANIRRMSNEAQDGSAYTLIDLDGRLDDGAVADLRPIPGIYRIRVLEPPREATRA
ncbi:3-phosphoglycerate dehydrogenase family protein [Olsenella uli]|uniref:3-phosphoglycerate dehydrogenase family protein n=1 Tax=Olsenella uli TaxID=133926 RepID=UPI00192E649C|nr:3-phosphoglycerate dehydrogenase family protein [Olsenella uli]MBS6418738.1 3-phosphoglycerate dehydrogenase [Olsenella uli]